MVPGRASQVSPCPSPRRAVPSSPPDVQVRPSRGSVLVSRAVTTLARDRPSARPRGRDPLALGSSGEVARPHPRRRPLLREGPRRHGRLPSPVHPSSFREPAAQDRARLDRFDGGRGFARRLGREPPPSSRVQRPSRRPALAALLRHRSECADCAASPTRTSGGCSRSITTSADRYAPELLDDRDLASSADCSRSSRSLRSRCRSGSGGCRPARRRRADHARWAGARPDHAAAPRHVERQLGLPHVRQPARTERDHSTNFAPLALLSFGESWHNFHHAHPSAARTAPCPHQIDPSAALIRLFERLGWATKVRWPTEAQIAARRPRRGPPRRRPTRGAAPSPSPVRRDPARR